MQPAVIFYISRRNGDLQPSDFKDKVTGCYKTAHLLQIDACKIGDIPFGTESNSRAFMLIIMYRHEPENAYAGALFCGDLPIHQTRRSFVQCPGRC